MFEVMLVSPEGTVIGNTDKTEVTIRDTGERGKNKTQLCIFKILENTLQGSITLCLLI